MREATALAQGPVDVIVSPLPCPFCGKQVDLEDHDTLYPSGTGWLFDEELQMRTYHRYTATPQEQWCYTMHCPVQAGGCGAEMHGDTRSEALAKWDKRANVEGNRLAAHEHVKGVMTATTNDSSAACDQTALTDGLEDFESWWIEHGQYCRAGGGDYEKTFAFCAWKAATEAMSKEQG